VEQALPRKKGPVGWVAWGAGWGDFVRCNFWEGLGVREYLLLRWHSQGRRREE
jgi:hypothetical protein